MPIISFPMLLTIILEELLKSDDYNIIITVIEISDTFENLIAGKMLRSIDYYDSH